MTPTYQIGPHRLYLGDAYKIRQSLGWQDVDCMDPQYDFNNSGGGHFRAARKGSNEISKRGLDKGFDFSIIDPSLCGASVVFCHDNSVPELGAYLRKKFYRAVLLQWIKPNPSPMVNKHYLADEEFYWHSWSQGHHPVGVYSDLKRHVIAPSIPTSKFNHPTVKPDKVMQKIMANLSGVTICDSFMGTGSTGVAAIKAGKTFTGIENDPAAFDTAVWRITEAFFEHETKIKKSCCPTGVDSRCIACGNGMGDDVAF